MLVALLAVLLSVAFSGCVSQYPYHMVRESIENRPPLDSLAPVKVVLAIDVPVLPENLELVATMAGANDGICIARFGTIDVQTAEMFKKWARELGANYVYVKSPGSPKLWQQASCDENSVEFLVEVDGGKNEKN